MPFIVQLHDIFQNMCFIVYKQHKTIQKFNRTLPLSTRGCAPSDLSKSLYILDKLFASKPLSLHQAPNMNTKIYGIVKWHYQIQLGSRCVIYIMLSVLPLD